MKKITKISIFILAMFLIFLTFSSVKADSIQDAFTQADSFINTGKNSTAIDQTEISNIFVPIAQLLIRIGTIVLAVVTIIMGIKYITASPEKKAELKTQLIGLALASIVIGGAQVIWATLTSFFETL